MGIRMSGDAESIMNSCTSVFIWVTLYVLLYIMFAFELLMFINYVHLLLLVMAAARVQVFWVYVCFSPSLHAVHAMLKPDGCCCGVLLCAIPKIIVFCVG